MATNLHIVELNSDQVVLIGACVLACYYDIERDFPTTDSPGELLDASIVLDECVLMMPDWASQLKKHYSQCAESMRRLLAEIRKTNQGL